ncbi:MAG: transcriptional regulator [Propionibacteriaceae bacterium]
MTIERQSFDNIIHSPTRLRICAALDAGTAVEFATLEEVLEISTSLLSKQLKILVDAGYVELEKRVQIVGRPRVWVSLTNQGKLALQLHITALKEILGESFG